MDELLELRRYVEQGDSENALILIEALEEMSREDKINKIYSFARILLIHLIKQHAEKRTTRSWDLSVRNATRQIGRVNARRKANGTYLSQAELRITLEEAYQPALEYAAVEAFEGRYEDDELAQMVDAKSIVEQALKVILEEQRIG